MDVFFKPTPFFHVQCLRVLLLLRLNCLFIFFAGVESLETAINYWEDALAAYQSASTGSGAVLLSAEEAEFCRSLERVLKVKSISFHFVFNSFEKTTLFLTGRLRPPRWDGTPFPSRTFRPVPDGNSCSFRCSDALLPHVLQFHIGRFVRFSLERRSGRFGRFCRFARRW